MREEERRWQSGGAEQKYRNSRISSHEQSYAHANRLNTVALRYRPRQGGVADDGREKKADAEVEEAKGEERDIIMTEAKIMTTTPTENQAEGQATNDLSDRSQRREIIQVTHCVTADRSRTRGGCSLLARGTKNNRRYWDHELGK